MRTCSLIHLFRADDVECKDYRPVFESIIRNLFTVKLPEIIKYKKLSSYRNSYLVRWGLFPMLLFSIIYTGPEEVSMQSSIIPSLILYSVWFVGYKRYQNFKKVYLARAGKA